jgi:hypothetical protein
LKHAKNVKATTKRRAKSEAELLDHATNNLLHALKRDMQEKEGRVDYDKLRKNGYSDRLLTQLERVLHYSFLPESYEPGNAAVPTKE